MLSLRPLAARWLPIAALLVICVTALTPLWFWYSRSTDLREKLLSGDYAGAFEHAAEKAKSGNKSAANTLGNLYYLGLGVKQDYGLAARWYMRAAIEGYGPAQANIGHLYSQGLGVPKDLIRTIGWYKLAQRSGYGDIEHHLKRKTDENKFNATLVGKAHEMFQSLKQVKKNLAREIQEISGVQY